jgi:hypothetical protein
MSRSGRPFPVSGQNVNDGSALAPGTIPYWMAEIVHARLVTFAGPMAPQLSAIEERGGFTPIGVLDLLAGGSGDGTAFRMMVARKRSIVERSQFEREAIERVLSLASDAAEALARVPEDSLSRDGRRAVESLAALLAIIETGWPQARRAALPIEIVPALPRP